MAAKVTAANAWAGAELAARRAKAGLTQEKLAALAGIDRPRLNGLEKGRTKITLTYAERLAPHLGLRSPRVLLPQAEPPAAAYQERSPLALLRGLAATVEKHQQTIDALAQRVEALERGGEGTQRSRKAR